MPDPVNKQLVFIWEKAPPSKVRYGFIGPAAVSEEVIDYCLLLVVGKLRRENLLVEGSEVAVCLWWIQLLHYPLLSKAPSKKV